MDSNTTTYTKTFSIDLERANYHLKCKKRKIKRLIIVLIMWLLIFVYFITPLSKVNLKVVGNVYYSKDDLISLGHINKNNLWWLFDSRNSIKVLESYEYIEDVKIEKSFFGTKMTVKEIFPVGSIDDDYILNNGNVIDKESYPNNHKINKITNLSLINQEDMGYLINKYSKVNVSIRSDIEKLEILRDSNNYGYVKLYGNNDKTGYFVIKVDLVYLDTKFNGNKYNQIIEEISKNNVKYEENEPCFVAYHGVDEETFQIVDSFKEESYD